MSVSIFAPGKHEVLGRGGRYLCGETEPATGLTLYPDAILRAAPAREARKRVYIPAGASQARAAALRQEGYATVMGLSQVVDDKAEAVRAACDFVLLNGTITPLAANPQTGD